MSMSMWASTSAEESNPAWLSTQLGFISPSKPCLRLYIACSASSKPFLRLYMLAVHRRSLFCDYTSFAVHRRSLFCDYTSLAVHRRSLFCDYTSLAVHRRSLVFDYTRLQCIVEALFATIHACSASSKPCLRLYTFALHRRSLFCDYNIIAVHRRSLFCDYNVHSYPVGNGAFASIFCYGCSSHRESIMNPSCGISSSSASPQKLFCGLASPSSMLCEVTINPKTECSVIGESTSVFGEMYVRFIFSIYKNHFTNTLRPFMI